MKSVTLSFPELVLVVGTRAMFAAGVALLVAEKLTEEQRKTAGIVLAAVGVITTIPLAFEILGKRA